MDDVTDDLANFRPENRGPNFNKIIYYRYIQNMADYYLDNFAYYNNNPK
jgi:hypothetical protein